MNSSLVLVIVLQLLAVGVVIAEVVLPSGGLLTIAALGLFGYSLYVAFAQISTSVGFMFTALDIVTVPVLIVIGLKILAQSPVTLRASLSSRQGVASQDDSMRSYIGAEGTAVSDLHPAGAAEIKGERLDVVTRGEYVEKGTKVVVVEVGGNRVVVEEQQQQTS